MQGKLEGKKKELNENKNKNKSNVLFLFTVVNNRFFQ